MNEVYRGLGARSKPPDLEIQRTKAADFIVSEVLAEYAEDFVGILNSNRQFVLINKKYFGDMNMEESIGLRPGEVVGCVNSDNNAGGCGMGGGCRYCPAFKAIIRALSERLTSVEEGQLLVRRDGAYEAVDVRVTAAPVAAAEGFVLLFVRNISRDKRAELMERAFFHDVLNTSHTLSSLISISRIESDQFPDAGRNVESVMDDIIEQIQYYKKLKDAEDGVYSAEFVSVDTAAELENLAGLASTSVWASGSSLDLRIGGGGLYVLTDRVLFRRIVFNMLKNAFEASGPGESVTVSLDAVGGGVTVTVANPAVMDQEAKVQIFHRSYSTKGPGRGIGTYSMKVLGEGVLKGRVDFESSSGTGTVFRLALPREPE